MKTNIRPYIMLDVDGVLATSIQHNVNPKKWCPLYNSYLFDRKCVAVFNEIIEATNPIIVLSSDWKNEYSLDMLNRIFAVNMINCTISDITPNHWGTLFKSLKELENCRASEILEYVKMHNVQHFVAVDDLNLSLFLSDENFVRTPRALEGIKQTNIKEKIINKLNQFQNGEKS